MITTFFLVEKRRCDGRYAGRSVYKNTTVNELTNNSEAPRNLTLHILQYHIAPRKYLPSIQTFPAFILRREFYCFKPFQREKNQCGVQTVGLESRRFEIFWKQHRLRALSTRPSGDMFVLRTLPSNKSNTFSISIHFLNNYPIGCMYRIFTYI